MSSLGSNNESAFGPRFIITIVLAIGVWMMWQSHMAKKYPEVYAKDQQKTEAQTNPELQNKTEAKPAPGSVAVPQGIVADGLNTAPAEEKLFSYEDDFIKMDVSSRGLAVKNLKLKKYTDRSGELVTFAGKPSTNLFSTGVLGRVAPVYFDVKKVSGKEFVGVASVEGSVITKRIMIESEKYLIHTQIDVDSPNSNLSGLVTQFSEEIQQAKQHTFIVPSFEYQEFFVDHEGTFTRVHVKPDEVQSQNFKQTSIASFGSQYFAVAVVDRSNIIPEFQASVLADSSSGKNVSVGLGGLVYQNSGQNKNLQVKYTAFAGPKSYDLLKSIDANLTRIIDFGFFTSIAKAIFWLMKSIYSYLGNWGIAIILLTIIIRMIVLPFNLIGYKQMKAMTKLQPQIKLLKEKYKNDSQKLNQEMITLMKEAKANPLGGCLPMLVQIPVFFALYQVIGHSIELYHAPFFLWIHDLSLKDPYFVLPILMALTMYIQQKITPSTLEPAQQKIMNFLPIIFSLLMLSLPSGLTLYLFISSVFGVVQQFYFTRENHVQS